MSNPSLPPLIYEWAQRWPQREYHGLISPSSLGNCMRAHYLKIQGHQSTTPPGPGALLNFELGRMWEEPVEKALRHAQVPFISQLYLEDAQFGVAGTLDLALFDRHENEWELVSIKTEGMYKAKYRGREGNTFIEGNPEYAVQEAVYRYLLIQNGYRVKDSCRYLVIRKDDGWIEEHEMVFTEELTEKVYKRMHKLRSALNDEMLPPCECEGWKVGYCGYGRPSTREVNKSGKWVSTECCPDTVRELDAWREEIPAERAVVGADG